MYRWDTPNELMMVCTSLGSHNKMFQTGAVAWGGSGSGSGLISMGPGSSVPLVAYFGEPHTILQ